MRPFFALVLASAFLGQTASAEVVLKRGNRFEPATLDPHKFVTDYEENIGFDLFEGLVTYDAAANPIPGVAQSWSASDDGLVWSFKLRPNLVWSDGAPLTANDVVFSFRRLMAPATAGQYAQHFYVLANGREVNTGAVPLEKLGIAAPTADTVVITLNNPAPYLPQLLANAFAAVVPRHAIAKSADDWTKPRQLVSNGAFTLDVWESEDRIELVKNPRFHDANKVAIDRVIYYPTEDLNSAVSRFRAGGLDMQMEFSTSQIDLLKTELPTQTKIAPTLLTFYLALNTKVPKLADARVRRALSLAIDRDVIVSRVNKLGEEVAWTFVPPGIANYPRWQHPDAALSVEQRLTEARRFMAEAGYGPQKPLKVAYSYSNSDSRKRIAVATAGMWKRIGIETELVNREGKVHFAALGTGDFEIGFVGWTADYNDAATFLFAQQSTSVNSNYARYNNPKFDALMAQAAQTRDAIARSQVLQAAEKMVMADQPIIPMYYGVGQNLVASHVIGWQANALDQLPSRYLSIGSRK
jgi:oligopeptide transport system substrate-binding protein